MRLGNGKPLLGEVGLVYRGERKSNDHSGGKTPGRGKERRIQKEGNTSNKTKSKRKEGV